MVPSLLTMALHLDAVQGAAVVLVDDHVLGHVHQLAGEVAGVGGLEGGVGQALAGAVGGGEVLQDAEALLEVGGDGRLDDVAGGLGHEAAHAGHLADLGLGAAGAGVGHDVDGVEELAGLVALLQFLHHVRGHLLGGPAPHFQDPVVAGGGVQLALMVVLVLDGPDFLVGFLDEPGLGGGHHQVVDAHAHPGLHGPEEAHVLHGVQQLDGQFGAVELVGPVHQGQQAFLLEQAVDEGQALRAWTG